MAELLLPSKTLLSADSVRNVDEFVDQLTLFQVALRGLADGIKPEMAAAPGGVELIAERLQTLPANIALAWKTAGDAGARS